jgi:hypothetical protein
MPTKRSGFGSEGEVPYEFTDEYERNSNDFYIEPAWSVRCLIKSVNFSGHIHDPACGTGTIPKAFIAAGFAATGSDKVDRGFGTVKDYFEDRYPYENIVCNPPYNRSEEFIKRASKYATHRIAILARIAFLSSQKRYDLFTKFPPEKVVILSRRPSMPPGGMRIIPQGGKTDFCWIVWRQRYDRPSEICWAI